MDSYTHIVYVLLYLYINSDNIFGWTYQQDPPCFEVMNVPECNRTLAESYTPTNPTSGGNKPRTSVYLFTTKNPNVAEPLHLCGGALPPGSSYDIHADTEIFIHGRVDGVCRTAWMREMKEQLFLRGNYNVILIDWTWGNGPTREIAAVNCKVVGEQVGFVINNIMQQTGSSLEQFHVIGHSLGAIASGFTGRTVNGLIRRITALDPSYGEFAEGPPEQRITYRDAQLVDVIHTNGYHNYAIGIGDERQLGHADFYPNGGLRQRSCYSYILPSLQKGDFLYAILSLEPRFCSHLQAIQYYKVSINSNGCEFVGVACDSYERFQKKTCNIHNSEWAVMGMNYELYRRRDIEPQKFFLNTRDYCPYYDDSYLNGKEFPFNTSCTDCNSRYK